MSCFRAAFDMVYGWDEASQMPMPKIAAPTWMASIIADLYLSSRPSNCTRTRAEVVEYVTTHAQHRRSNINRAREGTWKLTDREREVAKRWAASVFAAALKKGVCPTKGEDGEFVLPNPQAEAVPKARYVRPTARTANANTCRPRRSL